MLCNMWPEEAGRKQGRDSLLYMKKCLGKKDGMRMRRAKMGERQMMLTVNKCQPLDAENGQFLELLWFL